MCGVEATLVLLFGGGEGREKGGGGKLALQFRGTPQTAPKP